MSGMTDPSVLGGASGEGWISGPASMRIQRKPLKAQPGDTHEKPDML